MTGSRRWFRYTDDDGTNYALLLDESNTEAVNSAGSASATPPSDALPRNKKPRYGLYVSADGNTTRKAVFLTPSDFAAAGTGDNFVTQFSGVTVTLSTKRGERVTIPKAGDTGQIDGDDP